MGLITKIEEQKNKNRVNIFIDDSFFCGIEKETAIVFGLKVGKNIEIEEINQALQKSEEKRAFEKSMDYISIRTHSKKEIFDKLLKKGFSKDTIENTIIKLEEYHFIDDDVFARQFIEQNKNYSKMVLSGKLYQKGINKEIIEKNLSIIDDDAEYDNCYAIMEKYLKSTVINSYEDKQKLFAKLARRGFKYDTIVKVFSDLKIDIEMD